MLSIIEPKYQAKPWPFVLLALTCGYLVGCFAAASLPLMVFSSGSGENSFDSMVFGMAFTLAPPTLILGVIGWWYLTNKGRNDPITAVVLGTIVICPTLIWISFRGLLPALAAITAVPAGSLAGIVVWYLGNRRLEHIQKQTPSEESAPLRMKTTLRQISAWVVSSLLVMIGVSFLFADVALPMQTTSFAWRGWSNILWIWAEGGGVLFVLGVALCPAVFEFAKRRSITPRNYLFATFATVAVCLGAMVWIKSSTGYYDFQDAKAANTNLDALTLYLKSADKGRAEAAFNAALMLDRGMSAIAGAKDATLIDESRAFALYERAAAAGLPAAQLNLALLYLQNSGLPSEKSFEDRIAEAIRLLALVATSPEREMRDSALSELEHLCKSPEAKAQGCGEAVASARIAVVKLNSEDDAFDKGLAANKAAKSETNTAIEQMATDAASSSKEADQTDAMSAAADHHIEANRKPEAEEFGWPGLKVGMTLEQAKNVIDRAGYPLKGVRKAENGAASNPIYDYGYIDPNTRTERIFSLSLFAGTKILGVAIQEPFTSAETATLGIRQWSERMQGAYGKPIESNLNGKSVIDFCANKNVVIRGGLYPELPGYAVAIYSDAAGVPQCKNSTLALKGMLFAKAPEKPRVGY